MTTEEEKNTAEETNVVVTASAETENTTTTNIAGDSSSSSGLSEGDLQAVKGIKERLKFFFSDANIRQDHFLRRLLTKSDDKSVPVSVMLRFNTIKKISEKPAVVVQAAKELKDILLVNEEKSTISRVVPFTNTMMDGNIPLSLYVKNLPLKEGANGTDEKTTPKQYDVDMDEVRALFEKYGDVAIVKFRFSFSPNSTDDGDDDDHHHTPNHSRQKKKRTHPTGTAFVEFHNKEDLIRAAEATITIKDGNKVEPKEKVILPETENRKSSAELDVMLLSEHMKKSKKEGNTSRNRNNGKRDRDQVGADDDDDKKDEKTSSKFTFDWEPGCVIKLKGLPDSCDREGLLDTLAAGLGISVDDVKTRKIYADYSRGQTDGALRFPKHSDDIADLAKRLKNGDVKVKDAKVEDAFILAGDEEKQYWDNFIAFKNKQFEQREEERRERKKHKKYGRSH